MGYSAVPINIVRTSLSTDISLTVYGDAFSGSKLAAFIIGPELNGKKLDSVTLKVDIAPVGADLVCDVHKNDVTVFTTQANRPRIVDLEKLSSAAIPADQTLLTRDVLSLDIDDVGTTIAGGNNLYAIFHFIV
jgi:hypothetical protein